VVLARPERRRRVSTANEFDRIWPTRDELIPGLFLIADEGHISDVDPKQVEAPRLRLQPIRAVTSSA